MPIPMPMPHRSHRRFHTTTFSQPKSGPSASLIRAIVSLSSFPGFVRQYNLQALAARFTSTSRSWSDKSSCWRSTWDQSGVRRANAFVLVQSAHRSRGAKGEDTGGGCCRSRGAMIGHSSSAVVGIPTGRRVSKVGSKCHRGLGGSGGCAI
jgi:hypothetical protein